MKTKNSNVLTDAQQRFAKRWTITVSALYGLVLLGVLAVIVSGGASRDDSEGMPTRVAINDLDEFTVPAAARTEQSSQARPLGTEATDGVGNAQAPVTPSQAARAAVVPLSGVNEDIHLSSGNGHNKAPEPVATATPRPVPIPEVDEMDEDIHLSSGNRIGPSPQARAALAAQSADVLVENGWDFNNPDSIPGFGSMPQPASPAPDERRLTARTNE
jgi:hypothetical protein